MNTPIDPTIIHSTMPNPRSSVIVNRTADATPVERRRPGLGLGRRFQAPGDPAKVEADKVQAEAARRVAARVKTWTLDAQRAQQALPRPPTPEYDSALDAFAVAENAEADAKEALERARKRLPSPSKRTRAERAEVLALEDAVAAAEAAYEAAGAHVDSVTPPPRPTPVPSQADLDAWHAEAVAEVTAERAAAAEAAAAEQERAANAKAERDAAEAAAAEAEAWRAFVAKVRAMKPADADAFLDSDYEFNHLDAFYELREEVADAVVDAVVAERARLKAAEAERVAAETTKRAAEEARAAERERVEQARLAEAKRIADEVEAAAEAERAALEARARYVEGLRDTVLTPGEEGAAPFLAPLPVVRQTGLACISHTGDFIDRLNQAREAVEVGNLEQPRIFRHAAHECLVSIRPNGRIQAINTADKFGAKVLQKYVTFVKGTQTKTVPHDIKSQLFNANDLDVPDVRAVSRVPLFGRGGALRTAPGFDPVTRLYLAPWGAFPDVPERPTAEEMHAARALWYFALSDFCFTDVFQGADPLPIYINGETNLARGESSRAHFLALVLTVLLRPLFETAPLFLIDKANSGSGAAFLLRLLGAAVEGDDVATLTWPEKDSAMDDLLLSAMRTGSNLIVFDNATGTLKSDSLERTLTSTKVAGRPKHESAISTGANVATFAITANSATLSRDLALRAVPIRLAWIDDSPHKRDVTTMAVSNLPAWTKANRVALLHAALTLARYGLANPGPAKAHARFPGWSETVGGVLAACEVPGFLGTLEAYQDTRVAETAANADAIAYLRAQFGDATFGPGDALSRLKDDDGAMRWAVLPEDPYYQRPPSVESVGRWLTQRAAAGAFGVAGERFALTRIRTAKGSRYAFAAVK